MGRQRFRFFKFTQVADRYRHALAVPCDYLGNPTPPDASEVLIGAMDFDAYTHWPHGAPIGYIALCRDWIVTNTPEDLPQVLAASFWQGACVDISCDKVDSDILFTGFAFGYSYAQGTVNEEIAEVTITWVDLSDPPTVSELPEGLSIEFDTDQAIISGTPTVTGQSSVFVTGITEENECELTKILIIKIDPCNLAGSAFEVGELPIAEQFEPWEHEITYTDITDIEIEGLPDEITETIDAGIITLESEELPATTTYNIIIRGTTTENGCPISVEFPLNILPCESSEANILTLATNLLFLPQRIASSYGLSELTCETELPEWLEFYTEEGTGGTIHGGITWGAIADCVPSSIDLKLVGTTELNGCTIKKPITITISCGCPAPTNYSSLGASIAKIHNEPRQFSKAGSFGNIARFMCTNCDFAGATATGLPAGLDLISGTGTWIDSNLWFVGTPAASVANGTYIIRLETTVNTGTHAGCQILRDYSITVVD
jgi:hypothetical protein